MICLAIWLIGVLAVAYFSRDTVMDWTRLAMIVGWPIFAILWIVALIGLFSTVNACVEKASLLDD